MSDRLQSLAARALCLAAFSLAITPASPALAQSANKPAAEGSEVNVLAAPLPVGLVGRDARAPAPMVAADDSLSLAHAAETTLFPEIPIAVIPPQVADSTGSESLGAADALIGAIFFAVASLWIALR